MMIPRVLFNFLVRGIGLLCGFVLVCLITGAGKALLDEGAPVLLRWHKVSGTDGVPGLQGLWQSSLPFP